MCLLQPIFETVEEVSGLVVGSMLSSFWLFERNGGDSTAGSSGPFLSVRQRLQFATFLVSSVFFVNSKNSRLSHLNIQLFFKRTLKQTQWFEFYVFG